MSEYLATYLNDHLAGATAALELLAHLEAGDSERRESFAALRADIDADRAELEAVMTRWSITRGPVRRALGWATEKLMQLKLAASDPAGGPLKLLEAVEGLAVGIHGKGSLWRALAAVPALSGPDYPRLIARADEQRERIEAVRQEAARAAFGG